MPNQSQLAVTFSMEAMDPRTHLITYWFDAKVPGYECTDICFGLSHTGEWTTASGTFFNLEKDIKDQVLKLGRELLPKVIS